MLARTHDYITVYAAHSFVGEVNRLLPPSPNVETFFFSPTMLPLVAAISHLPFETGAFLGCPGCYRPDLRDGAPLASAQVPGSRFYGEAVYLSLLATPYGNTYDMVAFSLVLAASVRAALRARAAVLPPRPTGA